MIGDELQAFLHEGLGIHIGTRNDRLEPNGARALAMKVEDDGAHLLVYLAKPAAERVLPDLRANGQVAVDYARPTDERAGQIKGTFTGARAVRGAERAYARQQFEAFLDNLELIGIPRASVQGWDVDAATVIRFKATAVFEQTPGPDAGKAVT